MKKYLLIYSAVATLCIIAGFKMLKSSRAENVRLRSNFTALVQETEHYKSRLGHEVASVQALRLRCGEYEEARRADAERIRALGIRIRRLESAAKSVAATRVESVAVLHDTVVIHDTLRVADTLRRFVWSDRWVSVSGVIAGDSVHCTVDCVDTLVQVVHRVPRRFLFIKYGTKAIRQEIYSTNPHTGIVYTEYVVLERKRKKSSR